MEIPADDVDGFVTCDLHVSLLRPQRGMPADLQDMSRAGVVNKRYLPGRLGQAREIVIWRVNIIGAVLANVLEAGDIADGRPDLLAVGGE